MKQDFQSANMRDSFITNEAAALAMMMMEEKKYRQAAVLLPGSVTEEDGACQFSRMASGTFKIISLASS